MPLPSSHYSIVRAWTAVPLFIERWNNVTPKISHCHMSFWVYADNLGVRKMFWHHVQLFTSINLLNSDFGAKKQNKKVTHLTQCSIEAAANSVWDVYVRFKHLQEKKNSVIYFIFFVCLFDWLLEMKMSSIYKSIFACVSALSEGVVQFYKHKYTLKHEINRKSQLMPLTHIQKKKIKIMDGVVTSVTSL